MRSVETIAFNGAISYQPVPCKNEKYTKQQLLVLHRKYKQQLSTAFLLKWKGRKKRGEKKVKAQDKDRNRRMRKNRERQKRRGIEKVCVVPGESMEITEIHTQ